MGHALRPELQVRFRQVPGGGCEVLIDRKIPTLKSPGQTPGAFSLRMTAPTAGKQSRSPFPAGPQELWSNIESHPPWRKYHSQNDRGLLKMHNCKS
jgi:hypothetical protein